MDQQTQTNQPQPEKQQFNLPIPQVQQMPPAKTISVPMTAGILVVLIIFGVGMYAKYRQNNPIATNESLSTYTNTNPGFQFTYPTHIAGPNGLISKVSNAYASCSPKEVMPMVNNVTKKLDGVTVASSSSIVVSLVCNPFFPELPYFDAQNIYISPVKKNISVSRIQADDSEFTSPTGYRYKIARIPLNRDAYVEITYSFGSTNLVNGEKELTNEEWTNILASFTNTEKQIVNTRPDKTSTVPSDWKMYNNTTMGVSLKYPSEWHYAGQYSIATKAIFHDEGKNWRLWIGKDSENTDYHNGSQKKYATFDEKIRSTIDYIKNGYTRNNFDSKDVSQFKEEPVVLLGQEAVKVSYVYAKNIYYITVFSPNEYISGKDSIFTINYNANGQSDAEVKKADTIFNQILSTFKLTKEKTAGTTSQQLVGIWQDGPILDYRWDNRYQFFASGKYNHRGSQMRCSEIEHETSGYWAIDHKGNIILTPVTKITYPNGTTQGRFGCEGEVKEVSAAGLEKQTVAVTSCVTSDFSVGYQHCVFNGTNYYQFGSDPTYNNSSRLEKEPIFTSPASSAPVISAPHNL